MVLIMPVNLSLKNVPDEVYERLKARAECHHRSMNGEIIDMLERSIKSETNELALQRRLEELHAMQANAVSSDDIVAMIRHDRDSR